MNTIAVIGAGNIGTRHLEAALKCKEDIALYAVEPQSDAVEKSKQTLSSAENPYGRQIAYLESIDDLPARIDVAIVATGSRVRRQVTEQLLNHSAVRHLILEKVLFPCEEDYYAVEKLLKDKGVPAWVNCSRRLTPCMQTIRERIPKETAVSVVVRGGLWGLGCNAIHFIAQKRRAKRILHTTGASMNR